MKFTGRYCPIENGYELDVKLNEVAELTEIFIKDLIEEVGKEDYQKIAEMIIEEHIKNMEKETFIKIERAKKYGGHQHYLGTQQKTLVDFDEWKQS